MTSEGRRPGTGFRETAERVLSPDHVLVRMLRKSPTHVRVSELRVRLEDWVVALEAP